jgi:putative colanic acid biosynthesis UDP-glucose lipid carrier transferase
VIANQTSRSIPIQGSIFAALIAGYLYVLTLLFQAEFDQSYQVLALTAVLLGFLMFRRFDITRDWNLSSPGSNGGHILLQWGWMSGILLFLGFISKSSTYFSRELLLVWFITTPAVLFFGHLAIRLIFHTLMPRPANRRSAVIIFANESARVLSGKLQHSSIYQVCGYFEDREEERTGGGIPGVPFLGKARVAAQYVRDHDIQVVFVVLPDAGARRALNILDEFGDTTASLYYVPDFFVFSLLKAQLGEVEGVPVLQVAETPFYGVDGLLKQVFDFFFSLAAIIALIPVFIGVGIAVKLSSPGPMFFKQKRYGLNGKRFWVYKFRSMRVNAPDADKRQATKDDDRITAVGRFIRKTSLDELPQFMNVIKGEMSVVGPRPHTVAHNEHYRREVKQYMMRHKVKPGVTGWAQVNGLRGETANIERMEERIRFDLEYIRNWSPVMDIKIILMTVLMMAKGDKNAY